MSSPDLKQDDIDAVLEVLQTRYLSRGSRVKAFEKAVASYVGCEYAVAVSSGTSALHLAVKAAGIEEGELVITTPFSFIASTNCLLYERAVPVFVDVDPSTMNIDPGLVRQAAADLREGGLAAKSWLPRSCRSRDFPPGKLKAVLAVDIFGQPADMDALRDVTDQHDLVLIEDSIEALGAEYKGRKAGTLGDVGAFAFYPNKQMTSGEGGILVTDRSDWAALYRSLRNQGRNHRDDYLIHERLGYNYRLNEMSAALALSQLDRLENLLAKRQQVVEWYDQYLSGVRDINQLQIAPETSQMSWFLYLIQLKSRQQRERLLWELKKKDIPSRPYFAPIHLQPFYARRFGFQRGDYPAVEKAGDTCLALPFSGVMTEEEVAYVSQAVISILRDGKTA